ncbi:MAG: hypothetical protein R2939_12845 [Kofleriaceae bacterium]
MQIVDLLASVLQPGAAVVDLTPADAQISDHVVLPSGAGLELRRSTAGPHRTLAVLLRCAGEQTTTATGFDCELDADAVIHVVFVQRAEDLLACGVLDDALERGWELTDSVGTGGEPFDRATIWRRAQDPSPGRLRLVNEYRYDRLLLAERERELERLRRKLRSARNGAEALEANLAAAQAAQAQLTRERADALAQLERLRIRLAKTRASLSFRIGRATAVALRDARRAPWQAPRRWLETFRGPDDGTDVAPRRRGASR